MFVWLVNANTCINQLHDKFLVYLQGDCLLKHNFVQTPCKLVIAKIARIARMLESSLLLIIMRLIQNYSILFNLNEDPSLRIESFFVIIN